eukprot:5385783-Amphidinium_carterae.1
MSCAPPSFSLARLSHTACNAWQSCSTLVVSHAASGTHLMPVVAVAWPKWPQYSFVVMYPLK